MTVRMMLPLEERAHARPCPACQGHGVTGTRYEMPVSAVTDLQALDVVLLLEVFCAACGGCGNGDPDHAGCQPDWHPAAGDDDGFDLDGLADDHDDDVDPGDGEPACFSCGSGRGWYPIQGFTGEDDTAEMYTLRGLCGCSTGRLVPEGSQPASTTTPAVPVHTGTMSDEKTDQPGTDYSAQAAEFIAGVERHAALGLPELPDDPEAAAAMRAAGYKVLAEVTELDWPVAVVQLATDDEDGGARHYISAPELAQRLGVTTGDDLAGREFIATYQEDPETGPVLFGFRPLPAVTAVRCLLVAGDQAELVREGAEEESDVARWPAAAIAEQTGLPLEDLPGKVFRVRVTELDGRVLFSGFTLRD